MENQVKIVKIPKSAKTVLQMRFWQEQEPDDQENDKKRGACTLKSICMEDDNKQQENGYNNLKDELDIWTTKKEEI